MRVFLLKDSVGIMRVFLIKGQCWYYERVFVLKDSVGIMRECCY